jgi:hypothetical protein
MRSDREVYTMRPLLLAVLLLALAGCRQPSKRPQELAQCHVASRTPQELVHCLAIERNWPADSANAEGLRVQAANDSAVNDSMTRVAREFNVYADTMMKLILRLGRLYNQCLGAGGDTCENPDMIGRVERLSREREALIDSCSQLHSQGCIDALDSDTAHFTPSKRKVGRPTAR